MKNTDFRIGNYVMDEVSGELMVISELGESIVATVVNRDKYPLPDGWQMAPIPITAEWLKANGFADTQDSYYRRCIQNEDTLSPTMLVISRGFAEISRSGIGAIAAPCKYVHQLMNLYFALTGEELTVKEK